MICACSFLDKSRPLSHRLCSSSAGQEGEFRCWIIKEDQLGHSQTGLKREVREEAAKFSSRIARSPISQARRLEGVFGKNCTCPLWIIPTVATNVLDLISLVPVDFDQSSLCPGGFFNIAQFVRRQMKLSPLGTILPCPYICDCFG